MFRNLIAALLAILVAFSLASAAQEPTPDLILYNGKIFTSNVAHPYVQALAIRGERISATGDSAKIKSLAGPHTKEIDLGGRTVIPGINDAHKHMEVSPADTVDLEFKSLDPTWTEVNAALASQTVKRAPKGAFVRAYLGPTVWKDPEVTRALLDKLVPDHPVILFITDHACILNSAALDRLGIREDQANPLGGRYERSGDGRLTGVLREYASLLAVRKLADLTSDEDALEELRQILHAAAKWGITSIQDMSNAMTPERCVALLDKVPTPIRMRVIRMPGTTPTGRDIQEGRPAPRSSSPLITISGTKWMLDGTPLERTFDARDGLQHRSGTNLETLFSDLALTFPPAETQKMLRESLHDNDQLMVHVFGYNSAAAMLKAMQATGGRRVWDGRRVRFEHGDGLFPDLIPLAKQMGVVVVQNPSHLNVGAIFPGLSLEHAQPLRLLLSAGIPVALGSDGPTNPYLNMMFASLHPNRPSEAITREQAVIAYTATSAYAEFAEKDKGTLEAGKLADLAVLSQDIFTIPAQELPKTESVLTLVGGKIVYDANVINPTNGRSVPNVNGAPEMTTGDAVAQHIDVRFDPLPSEWVAEQNVMDPIWESLEFKGVNYYAYGRPLSGKSFAARSDPSSSLYQAWLGAYVIVGGKSVFGSGEEDVPCAAFVKLAQYDQKSWLAAMGDPHPFAESSATRNFLTIPIDGSERTGCSLQMATHSDVSSVETPLAKHMGMPPEAAWEDRVSAFHDVDLHVVGAWWYDPHRDISVIVYTASSRFKNRTGLVKDNDLAIATSLRQIMQQAKLVEGGGSTQ